MIDKSEVSFNISFLRESAKDLARSQNYALEKRGHSLIKPKLEEAKKHLTEAYRVLANLAKNNQEIMPAAEWLIDNFYIIQEQIVQVSNDFPREYQRSIPLLTEGELKGEPRVYELVLNLVTHTDNLIDAETLTQYVKSYQEEDTLMLGEVWAIPIMARFVLIHQLAEKSKRVLSQKKVQLDVNNLVEEVSKKDIREPGTITYELSKWLGSRDSTYKDQVYLIELANQFQSAGLMQNEQKRWFAYRFNKFDMSLEEALRIEAKKKSRLQVSIQNAVISLREVAESDWADFVEECSIVDQMLRLDPLGIYADMDQQTRDHYRRMVERLSRYSKLTESEVTEQVLSLAEQHAAEYAGEDPDYLHDRSILKQHVGYYLIDDGHRELADKVGYSMPFKEKIRRILEEHAGYYHGIIGVQTLILLGILWVVTDSISESPLTAIAALLIAFFPLLDLSITMVNRFFAFFLPPRILPKMEDRGAVPKNSRTLVVVPTMLASPEDVKMQLETLEIRSLANSDSTLQFALLSDFTDADSKTMEEDEAILKQAEQSIAELNRKYRSAFGDKFFLLHRERLWNETEEKWMGWERKRGKIEELNKLIYNHNNKTSYKYIEGDFLKSMEKKPLKFVITLDADTKLPPKSAINLVRTASHPLNRAWYDSSEKRITKGYGIIQPRISIAPESALKTWFSRIFSGNVGLDPYSTAVSDIYQDLNGEAVFTGKGIYDVEAFHKVMENRLPENRILSHDLIESTYLRAGLATDMELFDDYPTTYASYSKRNHRWTRGDWQIASWIFPKAPEEGDKVKNPINWSSKWKIFDNLRRSLNPFFLCLFLIMGWFWLPGSAWIWTLAGVVILAFPMYMSLSTDIVNRPGRVKWKLYMEKVRTNLKVNSMQVLSTLIILPHQAFVNLDAIFRTLWRIHISKKKLLEWVTASQAERTSTNTLTAYLNLSAISVFLAAGTLFAAFYLGLRELWIVLPFSIAWFAAPYYTWYISQPIVKEKRAYSRDEEIKMRTYARRIWFYFERFTTEEHSWLAPDNYQEDPPLEIAARTSPTNIGLAMVSTLIAYKRGYITFGELLDRIEGTLRTLEKLECHKGHLYNWYDTLTLEVMYPRYISTVDSGNLLAGLIVVKEAIKQEIKLRKINTGLFAGLEDTVRTVQEIFEVYREQLLLSEEDANAIFGYTKFMLANVEDLKTNGITESLEILKQLKGEAENLSLIELNSLRDELGKKKMNHLLFWLGRPKALIEKATKELQLLDAMGEAYGKDPIYELENKINPKGKSSDSLDAAKRWKKQAFYIIKKCDTLVDEMDFSFLYIKKRGLFTIGFNVEKSQADKSTYDLLASEARIASYIAIAKGEIPAEHWFRLSRRLTSLEKNEILLSWGGTMFEYLMPLLFMRSYPNTLLNHTYESIIRWQRDYGASRKKPWGFSESAYNFLNIDLQYQYRSFGAPGLGLKRGLAEEYVVAPYASMLSLMVDVKAGLENLEKIKELGGMGVMGFYDSIDFTPSHLKQDEDFAVVQSYMVHHHGMSMIAIENILNDWSIHDYFHSDQQVKSCDLLLQERIPRGVPIKEPHPIDVELEPGEQQATEYVVDHASINQLDARPPRGQLISNGSYSAYITHAGTGWSHFYNTAMTPREPDATTDPLGFFFYIKDLESGEYWSATHQPVKRKPDRYDTWFHNEKMVTSRVDDWIETTVSVCVSPDHPMEFRKLTLTNYSTQKRTLELTSYAEVVLNQLRDHESHPAFSKLFVQTEYLAEHHAIVVKRRPRSENEKTEWLVHSIAGMDTEHLIEPLQFETDRAQFIGRGRNLANPLAMDDNHRLSGSLGNVLDPIVSLRKVIKLEPGEEVELTFGLGRAESMEEAEQFANLYNTPHAVDRVFDLAAVYSRVELDHVAVNSKDAHYFQKLASYLLYPDIAYRADESLLVKNRKKQGGLWPYGISGDLPLLVFRIKDTDELKGVKKLLKAHAFWRFKGLEVEILILNDHPPSYADQVQEAIHQEIQASMEGHILNQPGGIFVQKTDKMPEEDLILILSFAHIVFQGRLPLLAGQEFVPKTASWIKGDKHIEYLPALEGKTAYPPSNLPKPELLMDNGYGGFSKDGDEYQIIIQQVPESGKHVFPPAPWVNIVANPSFGFIATERGAGYTWSENSRENKITSWSNDPVRDPHSEAFYLRDEEEMNYWSPAPGPVIGKGDYITAHGFGYTRYTHNSMALEQELTQFAAREEPVKISRLKVKNTGSHSRTISMFRYQDLVLGVSRNSSVRHIIPDVAEGGKVIFAQNFYNEEFAGRASFAGMFASDNEKEYSSSFTTDRTSFIGRNRSLENPGALGGSVRLDNSLNTGGDICAAFKAEFELDPGEEITFIALTGEAENKTTAEKIIQKYQKIEEVNAEFDEVKTFWKKKLNRIQVSTPEPSMDLLMNGWLMYQNIASRMFARAAFYQAGGAFGFRDQLQDSMATLYADPEMTRDQILKHASKQFKEGDVLHWWHPPTGRGIRSKISDDRLWLPYVTNFYIKATGDSSILDEKVTYIAARLLEPDEHEVYLVPDILHEEETLYEHCCKAIDISLQFGEHGLPLIGAGDWNDGMNRIGLHGEGESVWLGFFIHIILEKFQKISEERGDVARATKYKETAETLHKHLNNEGWDGEWYLRAFYDDGTPLGSAENDECKIDAISQSWSVISDVASPERKHQVLEAVERHLILQQEKMIRLLTPPFDKTEKSPGYIKGYVPGVRENGGQYTHAAIWAIKAFAEAGLGNKAMKYVQMINPINHGLTKEDLAIYKVEPYVIAADVYGEPPLTGRGGWTWYTGSAGWMYRVMLESILGLRLNKNGITLNPVISSNWKDYSLTINLDDEQTQYHITIENPDGLEKGTLEGTVDKEEISAGEGKTRIKFKKDGKVHEVNLRLR
ncbi:MAG: glucoamylase family protein [Balneolaceae bacterium]